jgi:hypothetical protein
MSATRRKVFAVAVVAAVAGWAVAAPHAQPRPAGTVPLSAHAVTLRVTVDAAHPVVVRVLDGGLAHLSIDGLPTLGLTPVMAPAPRVVPFEVGLSASGDPESLRQLAAIDLQPGVPAALPWHGRNLELTWVSVAPVPVEKFRHAVSAFGLPAGGAPEGPCSFCCVTCNGVTACARNLRTSCGTCCCPEACDR